MNLKKSGKMLWIVAAVAMLAMVLQGCGGDDGVNPTTHMDVEDERDMYKAMAEQLQATLGDEDDPDADSVRGMLAAANGMVTSLTGQLEMANGEVTRLMSELSTANGSVMSLTGQLETANGMVTSLTGELETANGEVTRLTGELGMANADVTRLTGELETANGMVTSLTGELETANGMVTSLTADLETANGMVTSLTADLETANGMVTSLTGDLETANGMVTSLTAEIEGDGTDANPGLRAQLATALARIAELEGGTASDLLDPIKQAAMDAATAAGEASTAAGMAADAAETAAENRASIQTGEANSVADAMAARYQANKAADEAMKAMTASQMAQDAANVEDATPHRMAAEAARDAAMAAQMAAETARDDAMADAMVELKIDGTMKSVGDVTIDATAPNNVVTTGTGATAKTVNTGFQHDLQEEMTGAVDAQAFASDTDPATPHTPYRQAVAMRDIDIGKVVDSADDMARLAIVTQYVGSNVVKVFAYNETDPDVSSTANGRTGTRVGRVTVENNSSADDVTAGNHVNNTPLRSLGTYYLAGLAAETDGLANGDVVGDEAEGMTVYSYVDFGTNRERGGGDDSTVYLVIDDDQRSEDGTTTYIYRMVDITAPAADADDDGTAEEVQVTANIPEATDYKHIHFGVWAALGDDGMTPSAHGIGFVQNYSGEGMTPVMPNFGSAEFDGNWVATVQVADPDGDGDISIADGAATVTADFVDNEVTVDLTGLAMLEGDISGSEFSGTKATVDSTNEHRLTADADFEGAFMGAFYGVGAAEAGGVFSFGSDDDNEDGAFAGAFGGAR